MIETNKEVLAMVYNKAAPNDGYNVHHTDEKCPDRSLKRRCEKCEVWHTRQFTHCSCGEELEDTDKTGTPTPCQNWHALQVVRAYVRTKDQCDELWKEIKAHGWEHLLSDV